MFADCKSDEIIIWGPWVTSKFPPIIYVDNDISIKKLL